VRAGIAAQRAHDDDDDVSVALDTLYQDVEKLAEETGRVTAFYNEIENFLADQRSELKSRRRTRFWIALFAVAIILVMLVLVLLVVWAPWSPLRVISVSETYFKTALIVAPLVVILGLSAISCGTRSL
jgi:hypothetical protein